MKTYCPYRICPLGAHIDHQYGVVSGAAINLGITFKYDVIENKIILTSRDYKGIIEIEINSKLIRQNDWADYFRGVLKELKNKYKICKGLKGEFEGDLPSGGISSSSSSMIAFLKAICNINNISLTKKEIINIVYKVEKDYMNLNVGILDPSMEVLSKKNSLIFLDTLTNYYQIIENEIFNDEFQFIIIYSGKKRNLVESKYNDRINELNEAYKKLDIKLNKTKKLRDIPEYYFNSFKYKLSKIEEKRCNHYYSEMERVRNGLKAWRNNDIKTFSKLMNDSCESSIYNYESGSEYLISLYNISKSIDGVLGFRFLGAGFNGSSLALIKKDKFDDINESFKILYLSKYPKIDLRILKVTLEDGIK